MSEDPYLRLKALVSGDGPYAAMTPEDAESALNAPTVTTMGSPLLAPDAFVARFTPAEFRAAKRCDDDVVEQLMFMLSVRREPLDVSGATVSGGLAHMVTLDLLTAERAAAIGAVPAGPNITPREQIGWPESRVWASDVIAARKMEG